MAPDPGEQASADRLGHKGGLLAAYRLAGDGSGTSLGWEVLDTDPLGSREAGDLWVHLDRTAPRARTWVETASGVPASAVPGLLSEDPRPRLTLYGEGIEGVDGMLLILRGVNLNPDADPEDMVSVRLWIDEHRIISLRRRRLMALEDQRDALLRGAGPRNSAEFVSEIAAALIERMEPVLTRLEQDMDEYEALDPGSEPRALRDRLSELRRVAVRLHRYLLPQRDVLRELAATTPAWFTPHDRLMVYDAAEGSARVVDELDEIRSRATIAFDELVVRAADRMNRISTRLTVVATIFLPLGFLASVWGMNVSDLPLTDSPGGFWVMVAAMAAVGVATSVSAAWMLRR